MKAANFDFSISPIVIIKVNPIEATDANFTEFLKEFGQTLKNTTGKIAIITDLTLAKFLSADLRIKMGNFYKENDALIKEKVEIMSIVNKSAIMNIVIKGVFLVKKPPVPTNTFSSLDQAIKWSEEKLSVIS
jgi:hypothetical protein